LVSPAPKVITDEPTTVSTEQLETEETLTVKRFLPLEQFPILPKTPTLRPGEAVCVLNDGVATLTQLSEVPPPPPGLPFWADSGNETKVKQATTKALFIKRLGITKLSFVEWHTEDTSGRPRLIATLHRLLNLEVSCR